MRNVAPERKFNRQGNTDPSVLDLALILVVEEEERVMGNEGELDLLDGGCGRNMERAREALSGIR